jgi:hypothetical protein
MDNFKDNPVGDMRPIKIKKKHISNAQQIINNMQNELSQNSVVLKRNTEKNVDIGSRVEKLKYSVNYYAKFILTNEYLYHI